MLFKESIIYNVDRSGANLLKIFHCYHRLTKKYSIVGNYIKGSVRIVERRPVKIRGRRFRPIKIGFIQRGFNNINKLNWQLNGVFKIKTNLNGCIIIKKRGCLKSPHILSPTVRPIRVKKFFYIFDTVV